MLFRSLSGKRPVLVFIHGGGLTYGSGTTLLYNGKYLAAKGIVAVTINYNIPSFGRHNIMNATAVIGLLYTAGLDLNLVREHLKTFGGVKRRFTEKIVNETVIIDDFAHHPTEIIATLDAARQKYPSKEIVAIFQPHTFTRTIALLDEFTETLNLIEIGRASCRERV